MKLYSKLLSALITLLVLSSTQNAQSKLTGDWEGLLDIGSRKLKLILHVKEDNGSYKTMLDSPDQGAVNIEVGTTIVKDDSISISDARLSITVKGEYNSTQDSLIGVFVQSGANININFGRSEVTGFVLNRPQTPKAPFPYRSEEVVFTNSKANNIKLAGTLTLPDNVEKPCAVVMISGSGAQNRNEKVFDHEPFLIIADHLSRNGIAVLRFDDRGTAESEGDFRSATSVDHSTDVEAAFEFLRKRDDINVDKIGLMGHSEGGMIAPMIAARNNDIAFIVLLAGPGAPADELMEKQIENISLANSVSKEEIEADLRKDKAVFKAIKEIKDDELLKEKVNEILINENHGNGSEEARESYMRRSLSPWFKYFISYDPRPALEKVKCPVLAINGELDKQVDAQQNLEAIRTALTKGNNQDFVVTYLPGINHALQEAKTGAVSEYAMIEQTVSPIVLETITKWILKRFK